MSTESIMKSILHQKPLDLKAEFDEVIQDRIGNKLEDLKADLAGQMFGDEDADEEIDLSDFTEEEIEFLAGLSDEALEEILAAAEQEEQEQEQEEPEESHGEDEEGNQ